MRGRRCVRRGSCRGGARGWRSSSLLMLRLRGCGCRYRSRNDKNCRDACVPLEHDTTSYVAHKSTPEMACGFRLRRGRGLHGAYMACDKFADHLFRILGARLISARDRLALSHRRWPSGKPRSRAFCRSAPALCASWLLQSRVAILLLVVGVTPTGNRDAGKFAADTTQLPTGCQPESLAKSARRRSHKPQRVYRRPREKVGVRRTQRDKKSPGAAGASSPKEKDT